MVMPSIHDWHAATLNQQTDFFSWGVVTFELFTGIHPYQGVLDGYRRGDFESRMKDNASVFTHGIRLNDNVRDFACIPSALRAWYEAEFQQGERSAPPSIFAAAVTIAPAARTVRATTTTSGMLIFERFFTNVSGKAIRMWPCGAILFDSGVVMDLKSCRVIGQLESSNGEIIRVDQGWLFADWVNGSLLFSFVDERTLYSHSLSMALHGYKLVQYENRLFVVTANELVELAFLYVGRPILSTGMRTPILQPYATDWFSGVGILNALGAMFLVTPFGDRSCVSVRVRELDGLRPVTAKAGNRFVAVIAVDKNGQYRKFEFSFNREYTSYTLWEGGTDNPELDMAILARGVCATITNDGELVIFVPSNGQINRVLDKAISTDMSLATWEDKVMYILDGQVWSIRLK